MMNKKDSLYAHQQSQVADFCFDEQVAQVFPDMIERSVPGYGHILNLIGLLAARFTPVNGHLYDLGCSLGAASLAMQHQLPNAHAKITAIDNSPAMIKRAASLYSPQNTTTIDYVCADINQHPFTATSFVVLNFTLQFIAPAYRQDLLQRLYTSLLPGGALVLAEKIHLEDSQENQLMIELHHQFKRAQGYSELEISQKRQAIEKVLISESRQSHEDRLKNVGFNQVMLCFQSLNFACFLAIK